VRRRVLIVEDESLIALDLAQSLADIGFDVIDTVASSDEALRAASACRPDMVLMDVRIQGERDGIETAALLRERFQVPVVYITAYANNGAIAQAIRTEAYGHILKPFNPKELTEVLEAALQRYDAEMRISNATPA